LLLGPPIDPSPFSRFSPTEILKGAYYSRSIDNGSTWTSFFKGRIFLKNTEEKLISPVRPLRAIFARD